MSTNEQVCDSKIACSYITIRKCVSWARRRLCGTQGPGVEERVNRQQADFDNSQYVNQFSDDLCYIT